MHDDNFEECCNIDRCTCECLEAVWLLDGLYIINMLQCGVVEVILFAQWSENKYKYNYIMVMCDIAFEYCC